MGIFHCEICRSFDLKRSFCKRLNHPIENGYSMWFHGGFIDEKPKCEISKGSLLNIFYFPAAEQRVGDNIRRNGGLANRH